MVTKLKAIEEAMVDLMYDQLGCLECVDAEEFGEIMDVVKDIEETCYYWHVVKAMEEKNENCIMPYEFGHMAKWHSDGAETQHTATVTAVEAPVKTS